MAKVASCKITRNTLEYCQARGIPRKRLFAGVLYPFEYLYGIQLFLCLSSKFEGVTNFQFHVTLTLEPDK